jgi:predicted nucleic-acid-binding protein
MIGVDTNVLLRLYVADDREQHEAARGFFAARSKDDPAYVSLIVLIECVWALTKTYKYRWEQINDLLDALVDTSDIVIERADMVADALSRVTEGNIDLVDALIAGTNIADGCRMTVTFDKKAARRLPSMELLS